ncbi:MAG: hypothetical protein AAGI37_10745 [Planctomycetota bacterium]
MSDQLLLLTHAAATLYMAGLIWFVQLVHYPLMAKVGGQDYRDYQQLHERRTTLAVAPAMFTELGCAAYLALRTPDTISPVLAWAGLLLVALLWLSTAMLQVPCHNKLGKGFDERAHRRLVTTNWLRTALWSARGVIALVMLSQ